MRSFRYIPYDTVAVECKDEPAFIEAKLEICDSPRKDFRLQLKVMLPDYNIVSLSLFPNTRHRVDVMCSSENADPYGPMELAQDLPKLQKAFILLTKRFSTGHAKLYLWPDHDNLNHVILDKGTIASTLQRTDATDWLKLLEQLQISPLKLPACFRRFLIPHAL